MYRHLLSIAITVLLIGAAKCRADVIYSTFGPGDSYYSGGNTVSDLLVPATQFLVSGMDYRFTSVELSFLMSFDTVSVLLMTDLNNRPGTVIESISIPATEGISTAASATHPTLTEGSLYWIAVRANSANPFGTAWNWADPFSTYGPISGSLDGGITWRIYDDDGFLTAYRVNGDPLSPVPEPGSLTLAALGVISFAGMAWRRRKVAA